MASSIYAQEKFLVEFNRLDGISLSMLDKFISAAPTAIFSKDREHRFLESDTTFAGFSDNTPDTLIGLTDFEMGWTDAGSSPEDFFAGDLQTMHGRPLLNENEILAPPGKQVIVAKVSKKPLMSGRRCIGVVGAIVDYTDAFFAQSPQKNAFLPTKLESLTAMEYRVLALYNDGFARKEMADMLNSSPHTIAWHLRQIREKFNITTRKEMLLLQEREEG